MSNALLSVEQAAEQLKLHPKTVLRYIREGRLAATRIGKGYRVPRSALEQFAGIAERAADHAAAGRTTAITDFSGMTVEAAERIATFLQAVALSGDAETPPLQVQTAFDREAQTLKVVMIGVPGDVGRLLEMLRLQQR